MDDRKLAEVYKALHDTEVRTNAYYDHEIQFIHNCLIFMMIIIIGIIAIVLKELII